MTKVIKLRKHYCHNILSGYNDNTRIRKNLKNWSLKKKAFIKYKFYIYSFFSITIGYIYFSINVKIIYTLIDSILILLYVSFWKKKCLIL